MGSTPDHGQDDRADGGDIETRSIEVEIPDDAAGERLDRVLAELVPDVSRSRIQQLIADGDVELDGRTLDKASQPATPGQVARLHVRPRPAPSLPEAEAIPLAVLHEDEWLAVIDKPAGMVVHPGAGNREGTLVSALLHRFGDRLSSAGGPQRPGIVHRLDKGTTGVLVVAFDEATHEALSRQFARRAVDKLYEAVVYGHPDAEEGVIDVPLGRDRVDRKKVTARTSQPRRALTRWRRVEDFPGASLLEVRPRTGRTHQIRAHLAHIHHPCIGDDLYAGRQWRGIPYGPARAAARDFGRPALHACRIAFEHPGTGERRSFEAPRPDDLVELVELLRRWRDGGPTA